METELKPCPFCGCKDIRKLVKRSRADIWCSECGVNMAMSCFASYSTLSDADKYIGSILVKNWNRRTPEILKVETNIYDKEEIYPDCTVQVLTNTATGETSVGWWRNE